MNQFEFDVLDRFYKECLAFWKREGSENPEYMAIKDLREITTNPFLPKNAPLLDPATKEEFIKTIKKDG